MAHTWGPYWNRVCYLCLLNSGNRNLFGPMGNHCATLPDTRACLQPAVAATILKKIKTVIVVASSCTSVMEKHFASSSQNWQLLITWEKTLVRCWWAALVHPLEQQLPEPSLILLPTTSAGHHMESTSELWPWSFEESLDNHQFKELILEIRLFNFYICYLHNFLF